MGHGAVSVASDARGRLPRLEHHHDSQRRQHARQREEKDAGVAEGANDRAGSGAGQEKRNVGKGGEDAEGCAPVLFLNALDRFYTERGEHQRKAEAGQRGA